MIEQQEQIYQAALEAIRGGEPAAVATLIETRGSAPRDAGAKMLVYGDGRTVGTVGGGPMEAWVGQQALKALADRQSRHLQYPPEEAGGQAVCGGAARVFFEVLLPRPTLLIIGAGHIGQAVAELGSFLGYRVAVLDERPQMVSPERFPWAAAVLTGSVDEQLRAFPLTERTYVVLVTPHGSPDEKALAVLAEHPVAYTGLLGGSRRTRATFERARKAGIPHSFLERIHTPIGLDIGADTPREIAVSILAQIIAVQQSDA